jgi:hypothetical protein
MKDQIRHALSDKATKEEVQKALLDLLKYHDIDANGCGWLSNSSELCGQCVFCIAEQLQKEVVIK